MNDIMIILTKQRPQTRHQGDAILPFISLSHFKKTTVSIDPREDNSDEALGASQRAESSRQGPLRQDEGKTPLSCYMHFFYRARFLMFIGI